MIKPNTKRPCNEEFWKNAPKKMKLNISRLKYALLPDKLSFDKDIPKLFKESNNKEESHDQTGYFNPFRISIKHGSPPKAIAVKCRHQFSSSQAHLNSSLHQKDGLGNPNMTLPSSESNQIPVLINHELESVSSPLDDYKHTIQEDFTPSALIPNQDNKYKFMKDSIFNKLNRTLLIDPSKYFKLKIDYNTNMLNLQPGVSFLAYCTNMEYHDTIIPVIIPKGYYTDSNGQFTLNEEVCELYCNVCKQIIMDDNPQGIGFRNCRVQVKYRDTNRVSDTFSFDVNEKTFAFSKFSQTGHVKYFYVRFHVA
ncbi:hypothetical protein LOD99_11056 [Oopsacas minuta]|uniref:Uncharacterized protein n=1 Tax=Oopsacas minuta TaxID=111878 RepID=A0AAV7KAS1_9METZ|nr:hypothetical protein LOD99_11056 [Oopsacas minuta]